MIPTILFAVAGWLCPPNPGGCVPVPHYGHVIETAPMPRVVPVLKVPERQGPRIVIPPKKG